MNKEVEYLLNEIKDSSQDYIGTNGCRYQDLLREELNLLLSYIEELQTTANDCKQEIESRSEKAIEYCENNKEYTPRLVDIIDILKGDE